MGMSWYGKNSDGGVYDFGHDTRGRKRPISNYDFV
jgi:hypothetical protein